MNFPFTPTAMRYIPLFVMFCTYIYRGTQVGLDWVGAVIASGIVGLSMAMTDFNHSFGAKELPVVAYVL
jgi:hypothetical protein